MIEKYVDILGAKMYMPVYVNFVVYLIQMFKSMKWHNKYFLMLIFIYFWFPESTTTLSKKKFTNCKTYVSNLL